MAQLNSQRYQNLNNYGTDNQGARPQTFKKVFITGEPRKGQNVGQMQCMSDFDKGEYIIQNVTEFYFIPMFVKKAREGYDNPQSQKKKMIYFSWNPQNSDEYPETAKCYYIFAGAALDINMKPYPRKEDPTKAALVYFKCDGMKMGGAIDYLNAINKATEKLEPISDNPEFEKTTVSWRRFIVKASVGTAKSDYGTKYVFSFVPEKQLPDDKVISFMDQSQSIITKFDEQFDMTNYVTGSKKDSSASKKTTDNVQKEQPVQEEAQTQATSDLSNIELGI